MYKHKSRNHDAIGDRRYLPLADPDLGRAAPVLQPGAVRGQRVSTGVAAAADTTPSLHTFRCGLATKGGRRENFLATHNLHKHPLLTL